MFKKILIVILLFFTITACGKNDYLPTAIITDITYDSTTEVLGFQVEITDKSSTIYEAIIELHTDDNVVTQFYDSEHSLYSFDNIKTDKEYTLKIKATYEMNSTVLTDKEIYSLDLTNYMTTKEIYFASRTFTYTGEKYSIYLSNVDEMYEVKYENNEQSEVGVYEVTAKLYLDNELIETYIAYIVISSDLPEILVQNQKHYYTSNPIEVEYQISHNAETIITYNGNSEVPTNAGEYNVVIKVLDENKNVIVSEQITMEILKCELEIYSTNKAVIANSNSHEIEVKTNVSCDYTVTYNNSFDKPSLPGVYEVIISINETLNHTSAKKHLTLTILDESEVVQVDEIFVSQVVYTAANDIIVELYNPTLNSIVLNDYKLLVGEEVHGKYITLNGSINSLSTFTISTSQKSSLTFNQINSYLVVSESQSISLYKNSIIDKVELGHGTNYIRKSNVGFPTNSFDYTEWDYLTNDINITVNSHEYNYSQTNETSSYEVSYKHINYINYAQEVNFNEHIIVMLSNERVLITNDMIIQNNINLSVFGQYSVSFKIGNYEFTTIFEVTDIEPPVITIKNVSLTVNSGEAINTEQYYTVSDISSIDTCEVSLTYITTDVIEMTITATDVYGNVSSKIIYIAVI